MATNLDLVRSIYADWERGDYFAGSGDWIDPEIECVVADGPEAGSWRGRAGLIEASQVILRAWDDLRNQAEEYRELDAERVLVLTSFSGRGKRSGLEVSHGLGRGANVFTVRAGRVTKLILYWDRDVALAHLGLER